jgi:hypothetical protein
VTSIEWSISGPTRSTKRTVSVNVEELRVANRHVRGHVPPLGTLVKRAFLARRRRDRIAAVKHPPLLVLAILVYVTLDLSLPAMPGAFVFEPASSAEGTHIRARAGAEAGALPAQARGPASASFQLPLEVKERRAPVSLAERRGRPVVSWCSRAPFDSPPPSEDPH